MIERLRWLVALTCWIATIPGSGQEQTDLPEVIADPAAGDWVVDRLAGNTTAGPTFFQGPAREVGGLGRCGACPLPDGRVLLPFAGGLAEIDNAGMLRLVSEDQFHFATTGQITAAVMAHNPRDNRIYAAGPMCVRRLLERTDGPWGVERVAGSPGKAGSADGPAKDATFGRIDSIVINGRGDIFILEGNQRIRLLRDGQVSTLTSKVRAGPAPLDGPLEQAKFNMIGLGGNLCLGEDDDTLYLSDHWNFCVRKIDLKSRIVSTVAGMPRPTGKTAQAKRYNHNSDGPALTWASFNSGCAYVCFDPVHGALWCGGPDENRFRWLKEGNLTTVIGAKGGKEWPRDGLGIPADRVRMSWNAVVAVDARGRAYLSCSEQPNGIWRAYPRKEVRP